MRQSASVLVIMVGVTVLMATPGVRSNQELASMQNIDVSWDFEGEREGWGNSTSEEMECELYHRGGQMRGLIQVLYGYRLS